MKAVSPNSTIWIDDERFVLAQITWELSIKKIDEETCQLTCNVISETESEKFAMIAKEANKGIPHDQRPFQLHISEETPSFGKDIERKALAGVWV